MCLSLMPRRQPILIVCLLVLGVLPCVGRAQSKPATLTVAAAADTGPALRDIAREFERQTGAHVNFVLGSSGNLATQIENGAPYDVLMSADIGYARQIETRGRAVPGSLYPYARGRLVLWALKASQIDVRRGWPLLRDSIVKKIAIANPQHAPYGRAAREALVSAGLYPDIAPKLVLGENVAQAAQFVLSGNAQVGLLPLALALAPEMRDKGSCWEVPPQSYSAIDQAAVVVQGPRSVLATQFVTFLKSPAATAILRRYGFESPEKKQ